ncbi:DNA-directed RNA polymerase subunit omega [Candidatus Poribacteria bacterium]|nr:DNA-directed RNA polymerase subunit omega [Candidatus Poribacteria bacterium]
MFKVSIEKLLKNSGGQYRLLAMVFQRLHQLNAGMHPSVKPTSVKNATIALMETAEGKVRLVENGKDESAIAQ